MNFSQALMEHRIRKGPPCQVGLLLAGLKPDEQAELEAAMKDERIEATKIVAAIKSAGWGAVGAQSLRNHRNDVCQCPK